MNVLTIGCFDLLHAGHANLLRECAKVGRVIAGVHSDESIWELKGKMPVQQMSQRIRNLFRARLVKEGDAYPVETSDPSEFIQWIHRIHPELIFMRGDDMPDFPGRPKVEELGIKIVWHPYTKGVSSTKRRDEL